MPEFFFLLSKKLFLKFKFWKEKLQWTSKFNSKGRVRQQHGCESVQHIVQCWQLAGPGLLVCNVSKQRTGGWHCTDHTSAHCSAERIILDYSYQHCLTYCDSTLVTAHWDTQLSALEATELIIEILLSPVWSGWTQDHNSDTVSRQQHPCDNYY